MSSYTHNYYLLNAGKLVSNVNMTAKRMEVLDVHFTSTQ